MIAEHVWPQTQTLQFDKKRFVIVAVGSHDEQIESTFYTDHHTKYELPRDAPQSEPCSDPPILSALLLLSIVG